MFDSPSGMSRQKLISLLKIIATLLIVAFSVYFSFWKIDLAELGRSFGTADYSLMLWLVPVTLLSHWLRAHRWRIMLETVHPAVGTGSLFAGVMVGYFMNNLIPRSGEIVRPWFTAQQAEARHAGSAEFSSLLGTIVVERFIDSIALLLIIAGVLLFDAELFRGFESWGITADAVQRMLYPAVIAGVVFILVAPSRLGYRVAEFCTKPVPASLRTRILGIFAKLQRGFGAIRTARQVAYVVVETAAIYFLYMLPLYIMFFAFPSAAVAQPTMIDGLKVMAITAMAFAVAPTPGAFGIFHVTARIAVVKLLGYGDAEALAYATLTHFAGYVIVMVTGGWYILRGGLSMKELLRARESTA